MSCGLCVISCLDLQITTESDAFSYLESTEAQEEVDVVQEGTQSLAAGLLGHGVALSVRLLLLCTILLMTHYLRHVHCC